MQGHDAAGEHEDADAAAEDAPGLAVHPGGDAGFMAFFAEPPGGGHDDQQVDQPAADPEGGGQGVGPAVDDQQNRQGAGVHHGAGSSSSGRARAARRSAVSGPIQCFSSTPLRSTRKVSGMPATPYSMAVSPVGSGALA